MKTQKTQTPAPRFYKIYNAAGEYLGTIQINHPAGANSPVFIRLLRSYGFGAYAVDVTDE